jgi:hypothetical protein
MDFVLDYTIPWAKREKADVDVDTLLENSKDQLVYIKARSLSISNSTKTFDLSTLYTTIPHPKLKDKD